MLILPLVLGAAWWLYRRQRHGVARPAYLGLLLLRLLLLAGVAFLAFRPNVVFRRILRYPGRIPVLIDDSGSMGAKDNAMANGAALRLDRKLAPADQDQIEQAETFHAMAAALDRAGNELRRYQRFSRAHDRSQDSFWDGAPAYREEIDRQLGEFVRLGTGAPTLPNSQVKRRFAAVNEAAAELPGELARCFLGNADPGR